MANNAFYHYFEKSTGPLLSLSALLSKEAVTIQHRIVSENKTFAAQRNERYLPRRRELERIVEAQVWSDEPALRHKKEWEVRAKNT